MKTMTYHDYQARIEYSDEDACFVGHIAGIRDIVGFHGESVAELKAAFHEAVDDYLETSEKLGNPPPKHFHEPTYIKARTTRMTDADTPLAARFQRIFRAVGHKPR
jgi:predicted HicB family RNase H-like nuclease